MDTDSSILIDFTSTATFVREDADGYPAVKITDTVWVDQPEQWITFRGVGHDAQSRVSELIAALEQVRDAL